MQRSIENEAYKPPEKYGTLALSRNLRDDVTRPSNFHNLLQTAQELDFSHTADMRTKKSLWQVFDRPNHDVPNFPDGSTRVSSTLAVYETEGTLTHAILRTSAEPYEATEFERDLTAFTKHYLERPHILGFPSQELTSIRGTFAAIAVGTVSLSAIDYYILGSSSMVNFGTIIGEVTGPMAHGALWALAERHAKRSISHPEQYVAGERVQWTLEAERYHNVTVAIQKELYQTLQQEGIELTPEGFLNRIYGQIPQALVDKRHAEVEQLQYPRGETPRATKSSLSKLVEVSKVLQSVGTYLQMANDLKNGLANS